jgi:hypothetical protein
MSTRDIQIPTEHIDTFLGAMASAAVEGFVRWVHGSEVERRATMSETRNRYCKNCVHQKRQDDAGWELCELRAEKTHPARGVVFVFPRCVEKNADMQCADYRRKREHKWLDDGTRVLMTEEQAEAAELAEIEEQREMYRADAGRREA